MPIKPVILCGGSGTRLWPLSTPDTPKQFLSLTCPDSMIAMTSKRLRAHHHDQVTIVQDLVVGSARHEQLLRHQLPDAQLILEPFGRNSAPAVAAACLVSNTDDLLLILPADHHIEKPEAFLEALAIAQPAAETGAIVTFGIAPTLPSIDYGYIEFAASSGRVKPVVQFVEKPPYETAKTYLESGRFLWNAGIFMFKAGAMLEAFKRHAPNLLGPVDAALGLPIDDVWRLDSTHFAEADNISIDYAIMEHQDNIQVVPVDMGWSDVGDYGALWEMFSESAEDNVSFGPTVLENCKGVYARSEGPIISAHGLADFVIVAKPDVVMITPKGDSRLVKTLGSKTQEMARARTGGKSLTAAKALLMNAFDAWSQLAWDKEAGGFVECLDMAGIPDTQAVRRVRVQARQVFSFSRAITMGWSKPDAAKDLVNKGLAYLSTKCRHPDGGWVHKVSHIGEVIDETRDLYDHAFIMMAGSAAFEATGAQAGLDMAEEALKFIDANLLDETLGGYFDALPYPDNKLRRSNPHMHLLEALMSLYKATADTAYLQRATGIVELFEAYFFNPRTDTLREYFKLDWSPAEGDKGRMFEPGHHYEWATLLAMYDELTGRDTLSWRRRLIRTADKKGLDMATGLAFNAVRDDGTIIDDKRRIWHQLELFRTKLWHSKTIAEGGIDEIYETLVATYFKPMPNGTWLDETDSLGNPTSTAIPASILYHLVTAFDDAISRL